MRCETWAATISDADQYWLACSNGANDKATKGWDHIYGHVKTIPILVVAAHEYYEEVIEI